MSTRNAVFNRKFLHSVRVTFASVALSLYCCAYAYPQSKSPDVAAELDTLLANKQYPQLEQALMTVSAVLSQESRAFFVGIMANRLNRVQKSLGLLEPAIPSLLVNNPTRGEIALCTLADDYAKNFRYGDAARVYVEADRISKQQNLDSSCRAALEASRWVMLSNAPVQTVDSGGEFTIQGRWDSIGLIQVPLRAGVYTGSWVVDSGANLSVISQSVAEQMGLEVSSSTGTADGGSGAALSVRTAIIPELRLGSAVVHNVPVLVAADSDLDFSKIHYRIDGSLGLPVLAALRRFTVYRDGRVRFGGASDVADNTRTPHNLFLEKFAPVITADFGLGDQLFTIDTGAVGTILSAQFYRESRPVNSTELVQLELVGAGGTLVSPAYQVRDVGAKLGGSCTKLEAVQVLTQPTGLADEFYGNIGESALNSFRSFTLDFDDMRFIVNGGSTRRCEIER
jgi:aspartyl protease